MAIKGNPRKRPAIRPMKSRRPRRAAGKAVGGNSRRVGYQRPGPGKRSR